MKAAVEANGLSAPPAHWRQTAQLELDGAPPLGTIGHARTAYGSQLVDIVTPGALRGEVVVCARRENWPCRSSAKRRTSR